MADLLNTSLSGLRAFQRALDVTGNNIANVSTKGYSRQRVDLATSTPQFQGFGYIGSGVTIDGVQRQFDNVLAVRLRDANSSVSRLTTYSAFAGRIDGMLSDSSLSISGGLQKFYNALGDLSSDPSSLDLRGNVLSAATDVAGRFKTLDNQLQQMDGEVSSGIQGAVDDINRLADNIAAINRQIASLPKNGTSGQPNDLLDKRTQMLDQLGQLVRVSTTEQSDGSVNVYIGSGQALVLGPNASHLAVGTDPQDAGQSRITLTSGTSSVPVTDMLSGGKLGGLLDTRAQLIAPTRRELGRLAAAFTAAINSQQHAGMDLTGALGGDLLATDLRQPIPASTNSGSAQASIAVADPSALRADSYTMTFDGSSWSAVRASDRSTVALTGSGTAADPYRVDGLAITISGTPAAGDTLALRPFDGAASNMRVVAADPRSIAAAAPIRTSAAGANTGTAAIGAGSVVDATDPALLNTVTIAFTGPNTYTVNGSGSYSYVSGSPIQVNGWQAHITGQPAAGDSFTVQANTGGQNDNRNLQAMITGRDSGVLDSGSLSVDAGYRSLVTRMGASSAQAKSTLTAQQAIQKDAAAAQQSVSGVNLDEEAANMLRYQQAYQAAAKAVSVADTLFQTLLAAVGR